MIYFYFFVWFTYLHLQGDNYEKRIERLTLDNGAKKDDKPKNDAALKRERIIRRAALEFAGK